MFDAFKMFGKIGEMKKMAEEVKKSLELIEVIEKSEDSLIEIKLTAGKIIKEINIDESLLSRQPKIDLEKRLVKVINSGLKKAEAKGQEIMKENLKDTMPNIPGFDLDNLSF